MSEKVLKMCARERVTLDTHSKPLLPERVEGEVTCGSSGSSCLEVRDNNRKKCVLGKKSVPDAGEERTRGIAKGQEKTATVFPRHGHFSTKIFFEIILD